MRARTQQLRTQARRAMDAGDLNGAARAYQQAVALEPKQADNHVQLARLCRSAGNLRSAIRHLSTALQLDGGTLTHSIELAELLQQAGDLARADALYRHIEQRSPQNAWARAGRAIIAERRGDLEAACALAEPLLQSKSPHINAVVAYCRAMRRQGRPAPALQLVERALEDPRSEIEHSKLHNLRGELLQGQGRCREAFEAFDRCNALNRVDYDPAAHEREVEALIAAFQSGDLERRARASVQPPRQAFIVGMPRSGTSLVEQILAGHPQVTAHGEREELQFLVAALQARAPDGSWGRALDALSSAELDEMATWYRNQLAPEPSASIVTNKLPDNYLLLGLIAQLFPDALLIYCRRDPRDVGLSCFFQDFGPRQAFSTRLDWIASRFRAHARIVEHFARVLPQRLYVVDYEHLVAAPADEIPALLASCDLPLHEACLAPQNVARSVNTASYAQVKAPIHTRSAGRHRQYATQLGPLADLRPVAFGPKPT